MTIREQVDNPELILSAVAVHAVFIIFSRFMKKVIDESTSGKLNLILTEIVASFMFICLIYEKGLWFKNVNETYFHVATAAQTIYFMTYAIGAMNPLGILAKYGIFDMVLIFPFQILGGLAGASFMSKIFWKQGFTQFHTTLGGGSCTPSINTDMTSGIIIESALVFGLQIAPEIEKKIAKALSFTEENTVMVCQAALIAFIVKTYIGVTGAMMNPLLAVVVNFHCLTNQSKIVEHVLFYWAGPMAVVLLLSFLKSSSVKVKTA